MEKSLRQIRSLAIPYPQKRLLELEVRQDLELGPTDGEQAAFSEEDLQNLAEIHSTRIYLWLAHLQKSQRRTLETASALFPLTIISVFISREEYMIHFIREGGAGMYAILAIGLFLLGKEILNMIRLLVVRDHTEHNLRIDTPSVALGCMGMMLMGIGWACFGVYISAGAMAETQASTDLLVIGVKESLTPVIMSSLLSALVVLAHYSTRRILIVWRAPVA